MIAKPNYTQVPNEILDIHLHDMSCAEIKVFLTICRKTIGWHKDTDAVSYTQLMAATGLARAAVSTATKTLETKGLIKIDRFYKRTSLYTVWFENQTTVDESGLKSEPENHQSGLKSEHTKESILKKIKDKDIPHQQQAEPVSGSSQVILDNSTHDKARKDNLYNAWCDAYLEKYQKIYTATAADWKQIYAMKILDLDPLRVRDLVKAWFSVPDKEQRFYTPKLASFACGWERAEALAKSSTSGKKNFTEFSGWEGK